MKNLFTLVAFILTTVLLAQAPQGFNYQATVRNNTGALIINKSVSFKFYIIPNSASDTAVYSETQTVTTDDVGQVSLIIGKGTTNTGTFASIDWSTGTYFLGIELNTGTGFTAMGSTQLLSVPYALFAKSSGNAIPVGTEKGQILYWDGTAWVALDPGTDGDILRVTNGVPTYSKAIPKLIIKDHLYSFEYDNTIKLNVKSVLLDAGGDLISKHGIALSTTNKLPTIADNFLSSLGNDLFYKIGMIEELDNIKYYQIENLEPNTTYYIRTYAENEIGIAYSNLVTFKTPPIRPTIIGLSKPIITNIQASTSTVESNIQAVNNSVSTEIYTSGYVVSKTPNPTIDNSKNIMGELNYTNSLFDLDPNTTYFVKSFLTNSNGTSYSEQSTFTTLPPSVPSISSLSFINSSITQTLLRYPYFYIKSNGGSAINTNGIVWSTSPNPTIALPTKSISTISGSSNDLSITGLLPDTTYYVRAFATNATGTGYSEEKSFTTLAYSAPSNFSINISSITSSGANLSGSINNSGGSTLTHNGIVWSTNSNPTIALNTKSTNVTSSSSISATINGLLPATTYYVRGFGTNTTGTGYSEEKTFTTLAISVPSFSSLSISSVIQTSAYASGSINNEGGSSITQKGIVWSTSPNPTIALSTKSYNPYSGISISNAINGLLPTTTYYVRAFATNASGTGYSEEKSFTTSAFSSPSISSLSTIVTQLGATSSSSISSDGGSTIIQKGIVWSTIPNPTTALTTKSILTDTGTSIYISIDELLPATTYYARAFATNDTGTGYSQETSFTTLALSGPSISSLNTYSLAQTSVSLSSSISSNGGLTISQKGFVWSTSPNPTVALTTKIISTATGNAINSSITGLSPATTYYVRAFATNVLGTTYSLETAFTTLAFSVPTILSFSPSSITQTSSSASSSINTNGGSAITQKGFVWSTNPNPTVALTTKIISTTTGNAISSSITELSAATTYYVRAFATNETGTGYSQETTFTTLAFSVPTISSFSPSNITQTSSSASSTINTNGGSAITQKGFVWSTNPNPTVALTTKIISTTTGNAISSSITELSAATTYYVRAFATNETGTGYSQETTFTTLAFSSPTISSLNTSSITQTSVYASSSIYTNGGSTITQKGYVWSTSPNPTTALTTKSIDSDSGNSIYTSITGLSAATTYYVRAFATNETGTGYSQETTFTTLAFSSPTISSLNTSNLYQNSVTSSSSISSDGGSAITQKGFVWSTSPNPTTALTTKIFETSLGIYLDGTIDGLLPATTYYLRAFATNTTGTSYSEEITFSTLAIAVPVFSGLFVNNSLMSQTTAFIYTSINSDGGSLITSKGLVWSTNPNPTTTLTTKIFETSLGNSIFKTIDGLLPSTTYYVRAFAANESGTGYSPQITFTTLAISSPTISSLNTSSITQTGVTLSGGISTDGGANITQKGFVWSTSPNPTTTLTTKSIDTNLGSSSNINADITGLSPATTYYVRAFATNNIGTSYSLQIEFTTSQ